jgi:hypothetical protein
MKIAVFFKNNEKATAHRPKYKVLAGAERGGIADTLFGPRLHRTAAFLLK